jgi:uncharacterized protein YndB with AHSA1/START domain
MAGHITVEALVNAAPEKAWEMYNNPENIVGWAFASPEWHSPRATNDLRVGGTFSTRMEARDGSEGFDFSGVYDEVVQNERIAYTADDGRKVLVTFVPEGAGTRVKVVFEAENENPIELQRGGWQAILDNYKSYTESH